MRLQLKPHYPDVPRHIPSDSSRWLSEYRDIVVKGNGIAPSISVFNQGLLWTFSFLNHHPLKTHLLGEEKKKKRKENPF